MVGLALPEFPIFEHLGIQHKNAIAQITRCYEPYSDFNFVSMFCYDTENKLMVSILNNNLIIKMHDYITREPFYSFLGNNQLIDTIEKLFVLSKQDQIDPLIRIVPEVNILNELEELNSRFILTEDLDSHDYIVPLDNFISLNKSRREYKKRFIKKYPFYKLAELDISNPEHQNHILDLFLRWEKQRKKNRNETEVELIAIKRMLQFSKEFTLLSLGVFYEDKLVGFAIGEMTHNSYCVWHFKKDDLSFVGIDEFLMSEFASYMQGFGCILSNLEQDLGIQGLKSYKQSWHPTSYLKKYTICEKI